MNFMSKIFVWMFSWKNEYALHKSIHKVDSDKYSPNSLATVDNNPNVFIGLPREDVFFVYKTPISV